jgi:hypothetical protein
MSENVYPSLYGMLRQCVSRMLSLYVHVFTREWQIIIRNISSDSIDTSIRYEKQDQQGKV